MNWAVVTMGILRGALRGGRAWGHARIGIASEAAQPRNDEERGARLKQEPDNSRKK